MTGWTIEDMPPLRDRTVVVTGANSGLGLEGSKAFARRGATVVMACRSVERGESAAKEIREAVPNATLDVRECDLADLSNVASFADGLRADYDAVDILCNNAGVMAIPRSETADGFETQFGVNHLGHFALTGHLLDLLGAADGESRIVTQSSGAHEMGEIDFDDLQRERSYGKWSAYGQSKLANLLFAYELQRRLGNHGWDDVLSVACHPGYADTDLQFRGPQEMGSTLRTAAMGVANAVFAQSAEQGALPMLYAATAEDVIGGEYVGPGGLFDMRGSPEFQQSNDASQDEETAEQLWAVSTDLTGVEYDFERT
ncbi:oxidoreductase [Haloarcula marismortui]|uniref:Short chain dehydrogenase/reductase family oxidoreductase n=1 Tax=Haloarcula marismortui ATCC 33799 TaxID=662475 RepID=M0K6K7_9EURY|nr:oxidoreductase [Haloarcula californiae]EMA16458.1 short chain dehydrogenase/reductase family oxidoreductase [Haloarcula californiae ATCC 33799]